MVDTRPLHEKVRAIGNRFAAVAEGYRKTPYLKDGDKIVPRSPQDYDNAHRDAETLLKVAEELERMDGWGVK